MSVMIKKNKICWNLKQNFFVFQIHTQVVFGRHNHLLCVCVYGIPSIFRISNIYKCVCVENQKSIVRWQSIMDRFIMLMIFLLKFLSIHQLLLIHCDDNNNGGNNMIDTLINVLQMNKSLGELIDNLPNNLSMDTINDCFESQLPDDDSNNSSSSSTNELNIFDGNMNFGSIVESYYVSSLFFC